MANEKGRELSALLFLEGRSIPFMGANCTFNKGQPGVATIEVPPLPEIKRIKPRTMCHVFIKDFTAPPGTKPWILMFEGEVYGYSQGKSVSSRSFNIYAMDYSNYWDNAKQFYMNLRSSFGDQNQIIRSSQTEQDARDQGARIQTTTTSIRAYLTQIISNKLSEGSDSADFLAAILEIVKKIEEVNPFFRYNQARYRINDRLIFSSSNNLDKLFDFLNRENLWDSITGQGNGGFTTIRQIVNLLMSLVFHDFVSVPCPSKVNKEDLSRDGIGSNGNQTIGSFLFKPNTFMMPPPKCNVLYPDMYSNFSFSRNFFHEVSRMKLQPVPLAVEATNNIFSIVQKSYFVPNGFNKFRTGEDFDDSEGDQFESEIEQGQFNDDAEGLETGTKLQDFNYLSREEILKGIFSEMGNTIPSAQILTSLVVEKQQDDFFRQAANYLFYKKRLASRRASCAGPLNPAPVPGFTCLVLDDSDAEQNVIGVLEGVTHNINATGGGTTQYMITYARDVDEEDLWSGDSSEPPIPSWYDPGIFGQRRALQDNDFSNLPRSEQDKVKRFANVTGFEGTSIAEYYQSFFGRTVSSEFLGAEPIVSDRFPNMYAATLAIVQSYRSAKKNGTEKDFVRVQTRRDYVLLSENFEFLGATIKSSQKRINFLNKADIIFSGAIMDGGYVDLANNENARDQVQRNLFGSEAVAKRRDPVDLYRRRLLRERGFRG